MSQATPYSAAAESLRQFIAGHNSNSDAGFPIPLSEVKVSMHPSHDSDSKKESLAIRITLPKDTQDLIGPRHVENALRAILAKIPAFEPYADFNAPLDTIDSKAIIANLMAQHPDRFPPAEKAKILNWSGFETVDAEGNKIDHYNNGDKPKAENDNGRVSFTFRSIHTAKDGEICTSELLAHHLQQQKQAIKAEIIQQACAYNAAYQQQHGTPLFNNADLNLIDILATNNAGLYRDGVSINIGIPKSPALPNYARPEDALGESTLAKLDVTVLGSIIEHAVLKTCSPELFSRIAPEDAIKQELQARLAGTGSDATLENLFHHSELFSSRWSNKENEKDKISFSDHCYRDAPDKEGEGSVSLTIQFPRGVSAMNVVNSMVPQTQHPQPQVNNAQPQGTVNMFQAAANKFGGLFH